MILFSNEKMLLIRSFENGISYSLHFVFSSLRKKKNEFKNDINNDVRNTCCLRDKVETYNIDFALKHTCTESYPDYRTMVHGKCLSARPEVTR